MKRSEFLLALGVVGLGDPGGWTAAPSGGAPTRRSPGRPPGGFPQHDPARVQAVVGACHGNFDRVRELVSQQPALAKASWDWGFGDWESALGAASHTGRREIALYLIGHGARPTIFSAAMLGDLPTVEAFLAASPELHSLHGPHGISLMRHARAGRERARPVLDFLVARFGPDDIPFGFEGDEEVEARYGGTYHFDMDPPLQITVGVRNGWLMAGAGEEPSSRLIQLEGDLFHPSGAPAVRFRFFGDGDRVDGLVIEDGPVGATGSRS